MQDQKPLNRSIEAAEEELARLNAKRAELIANYGAAFWDWIRFLRPVISKPRQASPGRIWELDRFTSAEEAPS